MARLTSDVRDLGSRVGRQRRALDRHARRIERLQSANRRRAQAERERAAHLRMLRLDMERMSSQLGALETRFADALDRFDLGVPVAAPQEGDDPAVAEVRARLDEVRREHEQIRVRFRVVTSYEERIRRLEESAFGEDTLLPEFPVLDPVSDEPEERG